MASQNKQLLSELYVATFNRAPDALGLAYWEREMDNGMSLEAIARSFFVQPETTSTYPSTMPIGDFVDKVYFNVLNRTTDAEGKAYWVKELTTGSIDRAKFILAIINAAKVSSYEPDRDTIANKAEVGLYFADSMMSDDVQLAYKAMSVVNSSDASIANAKGIIDAGVHSELTHTLTGVAVTEINPDILIDPVITKTTYWGCNECAEEGVNSGVPLTEVWGSVITPIFAKNAAVLQLLSSVNALEKIREITVAGVADELQDESDVDTLLEGTSGGDGSTVINNEAKEGDYTGNYEITFTMDDGNTTTAMVQLSAQEYAFLNSFLFDANGNSRLYTVLSKTYPKVVLRDADGNAVKDYQGNDILVDLKVLEGGTTTYTMPVVLTPTQNNGGTFEGKFTTAGDDTIVAGRLELLHQAYIDGGAGYNTLEVDAKGYFAQPLELLNIQQVNIENLPNVYTLPANPLGSAYDVLNNSSYPDLDPDQSASYTSSIIDLSRATSLEKLVVTEGDYQGLQVGHVQFPGTLTITGIRNGVETVLDGSFENSVKLNYGALQGDGIDLVFNNLSMGDAAYVDGTQLLVAHNAEKLNIESTGGGNFIHDADFGGLLSTINITGNAHLYIAHDLDDSMHDANPITINASANTGGVNLTLTGSQNVTFLGSQGSDIFKVSTVEDEWLNLNNASITIIDGGGNNRFQVSETYRLDVTLLDGNNNLEVEDAVAVNIQAGNGNNHFELEGVAEAIIVAGDGNNRFEICAHNEYDSDDTAYPWGSLDYPNAVYITAGNGRNDIDVDTSYGDEISVVNVTVGNGGNAVNVYAATISVTTGTGADNIRVAGGDITVNAGGSNNSITIVGTDNDYTNNVAGNTNNAGAPYATDAGAKIVIDAGANSTVILGSGEDLKFDADDDFPGVGNLTAKEGSSITGTNVKLVVDTIADLRAADLSGITRIVLDDDASSYAASGLANAVIDPATGLPTVAVSRAVLTLTSTQLLEIGAAAFSVDGAIFNTHAYVRIIVDQTTSLTALGVDGLPRNIDLLLEVQDGVTLTMTAEQLHKYVAPQGVTLAHDGNTDYAAGKVVITGGGLDFDPFNTSDTVKTNIAGNVYYGGSLSDDFKVDSAWYNVSVKSLVNGYDRPADVPVEVVITLDSGTGVGSITQGAFSTWHTNLEIVGEKDINFTGAIQLGMDQGVPTNPFTIDFSGLDADMNGFTVDNFELLANGGGIYGNADLGYASVVQISIANDVADGVGFDEADAKALVSKGVSKYVVTVIDGPTAAGSTGNTATIKLCDSTQDLEVFALRGNYNDTLVIEDAAWGLAFELQGGTTAKADGPTGTANVGKLVANYEWPGAVAVVNLVHSVAGDTRPILAYGIEIDNAKTIAINVDGSATIKELTGDKVKTLNLSAEGNLTINTDLPATLTSVDASGVDGNLSVTIDLWEANATPLTFIGAAGSTTLTIDDAADDAIASISGAGAIALIIGDGVGTDSADLSGTALSNIASVTLANHATLTVTMDQADAIGAANFALAAGAADANLNLLGLSDQEFSVGNYQEDINITLTLANDPVITLHANTNLTGIAGLNVAEGTTLYLTMAQFQQLNGDGTITGAGNVVIYDVTQADVGVKGADLDMDDVDVTGTITLILAESVDLSAADIYNNYNEEARIDRIELGDDMTLILGDIQNADGVAIVGGANSTLQFNDTASGAFEVVDASGFDVTYLKVLNVLVANRNVDLLFTGLSETITKVIYNGLGWVTGVDQTVVLEAGTTVNGWIVFNKPEASTEIQNFTLNLEGGTEITGNLRLSASAAEEDQLQTHLQTVTINSTGTAENLLTGKTANIIGGQITSQGTGNQGSYFSVDNNLLNLTINADQALIVTGGVVFESVVGDDSITANDDDAAIAALTVNGTADVNIGILNTIDTDVDGLNVVNNGTGILTATVSDATSQTADILSFTGTGAIRLNTTGTTTLTNDTLTAVTRITIAEAGTLNLTQAQFNTLGAANLFGTTGGASETLNLSSFQAATAFDATTVASTIAVGTITLASGAQVMNAATNLTNVGSIIVPNNGTLTLTAAQFQQLADTGSIVTSAPGNTFTVNITGLTQADVDAGFSLAGIVNANAQVNITLGEPTVTLGKFDAEGNLVPAATAILKGTAGTAKTNFILADGQTLELVNSTQADALGVTKEAGATNTTLVLRFADMDGLDNQINAANYAMDNLRALATFVGGENVEYLLLNVNSSITEYYFHDPLELGLVLSTNRVVVVEAGVTVPGYLMYNDPQDNKEVRTLDFTLSGNSTVNGNINLSTIAKDVNLTQQYFDTLTVRSIGTSANTINGSILATGVDVSPTVVELENNLKKVVIDATQNLTITGDIVFTDRGAITGQTAQLTLTGSGNVTVEQLDVTDAEIGILTVANNGTGTLTVTGASPAINGDLTSITFSGTGNVVLGDMDTTTPKTGISSETLTSINASGLTGNLNLGEINVNQDLFTFTSGSGVTRLLVEGDTLADSADVGNNASWTFNLSNAAAGSQLHLGTNTYGSVGNNESLSISLGNNTVLYIDQDTDFTNLESLSITGVQSIVLADGKTLTLTAAQANGLNIVAGPDTGVAGITAKVNIINLTNDTDPDNPANAFDLSGIAQNIAGTITFAAGTNDVTLDKATDLGFFSITLEALQDSAANSLSGQTIRFQNVAQAERTVLVTGDGDGIANGNSTNVVWLFNDITAPVNTSGYFKLGADAYTIGRLWMSEDLINNEGGNVEQLFTTLPNAVLRVDFTDLTALDVLLNSNSVNRVVEMVSFTNLGNLTFIDTGASPEEHIENLTIKMGGQVTVGNIVVGDVVAGPNTDPDSVHFDTLTLDSHRVLKTGDLLAPQGFTNDNAPPIVAGEHQQPTAVNTVGNILVGGTNPNVDLLDVVVNTYGLSVAGNGSAGQGAALVGGTITFDSEVPNSTATLEVTGVNNVTFKALNTADADITTLTVDATDHFGTFTVTGGSPAAAVSNTEVITIDTAAANTTITITAETLDGGDESITVNYVLNGVAGSVVINDPAIDFTDADSVAAVVAAALNAIDGIAALATGVGGVLNGVLNIRAEDASTFSLTSIVVGGTVDTLEATIGGSAGWGTVYLGTAFDNINNVPYAGVAGSTLSVINVNGGGYVNLGTIALIDSTDDGVAPAPVSDAFTLNGNGFATTIARLGAANVDGAVVSPTLQAEQTWAFNEVTLTITDDVVFQADSNLSLTNVELYMEGSVDLSQVNLDLTGVGIYVPAGESLTLALDQIILADTITGEGTVFVVGEVNTDAAVTLDLSNIQTVGIDLSGIINVGVIVPQANPVVITTEALGARDDNGDAVGFNIIGTIFNDTITGSDEDDTINGGAGDDILTGGDGSNTFLVTAGTDTITDLYSDDPNALVDPFWQDVLVVSNGATANATVVEQFYATAATSNAGTANLTADADGDSAATIDMTLASGPNGYSITGDATAGVANTLIGSAFADTINGGNSIVASAADIDTLTGGAGADTFVFDHDQSDAYTGDVETDVVAIDRELLTITAAAAANDVNSVVIYFRNNAVNSSRLIDLDGTVDTTNATLTAAYIAAQLSATITGVTFTSNLGVVTATAATGNEFDFRLPPAVLGTDQDFAVVASDGVDVDQETTLTLVDDGGVTVAGEAYTVTVNLADGTVYEATYVAGVGESIIQVAAGLAAAFNFETGDDDILADASAADGSLLFTNIPADYDGGFTVSFSSSGALNGTGASILGADLLGGSVFADAYADVIVDFNGAQGDRIDLNIANGTTGVGGNYVEFADGYATYALAVNAANDAMNETVLFYMTHTATDGGLLFFDANADGTVDGVVNLTGVTAATFEAGFIIA